MVLAGDGMGSGLVSWLTCGKGKEKEMKKENEERREKIILFK